MFIGRVADRSKAEAPIPSLPSFFFLMPRVVGLMVDDGESPVDLFGCHDRG